jgi:VIT1/CCC1 family predicted Fe2+/Mn2+ transporter
MKKELSPALRRRILKMQKAELDGSILYEYIARRQKLDGNAEALMEMSRSERSHYEMWKSYTGQELRPNYLKVALFKVVSRIFGDTFTIKFFERSEELGINDLKEVKEVIPEAGAVMAEEEEHERRLMAMVDEECLHYVGAMVLGLNDALVELTGAIAGLTFALANTKLVALSAIITGASATLSMAASNYLAERADGNSKALKSSAYTGIAYLVTVVLMVAPYLLLPDSLYMVAFAVMLSVVILIILLFNYYISVAQDKPFLRRFGEMAAISLGVAAISFVIGLAAKALLGVDL